jgi:hypothetical protein
MRDGFGREKESGPSRATLDRDLERNDRFGATVLEIVAGQLHAHADALRIAALRTEHEGAPGGSGAPEDEAAEADHRERAGKLARQWMIFAERARTPRPRVDEDDAMVYGRVYGPDGRGIAGLTVSLITGAKTEVERSVTDDAGRFSLHWIGAAASPDRKGKKPAPDHGDGDDATGLAARLMVRDAKDKIRHRDERPMRLAPGTATYREVALPA